MTMLKAPSGTLTEGVVDVRLPSQDAGDIATANRYVEDEQLDGGWLPHVPLVTGDELVQDWLDCWNGDPSRPGATFTLVVNVPEEPRFIGVVGVAEGDDGAFEMSYGTAPRRRGQWVARQPGVRTVETLIDEGQRASERVAVNAGFVLADTMAPSDAGTDDTVQLRYVMNQPGAARSR